MGGSATQESGQLGHAIKWARVLGGRVLALEFGDKGAMTSMLGRVSAYSEGGGAKGPCVDLVVGWGLDA